MWIRNLAGNEQNKWRLHTLLPRTPHRNIEHCRPKRQYKNVSPWYTALSQLVFDTILCRKITASGWIGRFGVDKIAKNLFRRRWDSYLRDPKCVRVRTSLQNNRLTHRPQLLRPAKYFTENTNLTRPWGLPLHFWVAGVNTTDNRGLGTRVPR